MICEKCGRALKDAESIQRGYGPICYKKMNPQPIRSSNGSPSGYNLADDKNYSVPGQMELSEFMDMGYDGRSGGK